MTNKIVGIFGGAFDPVHKGHIKIAEQCIETIGMEKIIIVPTGVSPFKKDLTNEKTRLSILQIAFSKDHYEISDYELRQSKKDKNPSYTINTLKFLTKKSPSSFVLIMGSDALATINRWYQWEMILNYCHILVVSRKEDDLKVDGLDPKVFDFVTKHKIDKLEDLSIKDKGGIYFANFPLLPFSSTDIRNKMSQKKSIENLVTPEVSDFIKKTASYTSDGHKI